MGWGLKAIEIRCVETGHLDGVFMHKKDQRLKFLCERNDKVREIGFPFCNLHIVCISFAYHLHIIYIIQLLSFSD